MYINQLSQEKQDYVKSRLEPILQATGLEGDLLSEAIQHAMDSKLDDLGEILSYEERQNLKGDEEIDERKEALEQYLKGEAEEIEVNIYEIDGGEYLVLNEDEAREQVAEHIEESAWAFLPSFLSNMTELPIEVFDALQPRCEDSNDAIVKLINITCGMEDFVTTAIDCDGMGHFLATYDHDEIELDGGLYAYRID